MFPFQEICCLGLSFTKVSRLVASEGCQLRLEPSSPQGSITPPIKKKQRLNQGQQVATKGPLPHLSYSSSRIPPCSCETGSRHRVAECKVAGHPGSAQILIQSWYAFYFCEAPLKNLKRFGRMTNSNSFGVGRLAFEGDDCRAWQGTCAEDINP